VGSGFRRASAAASVRSTLALPRGIEPLFQP
jgi:hypothetical protein